MIWPLLATILAALSDNDGDNERARVNELTNRLGLRTFKPGYPGAITRRYAWVKREYGDQVRRWTESFISDNLGFEQWGHSDVNPLIPWIAWNYDKELLHNDLWNVWPKDLEPFRDAEMSDAEWDAEKTRTIFAIDSEDTTFYPHDQWPLIWHARAIEKERRDVVVDNVLRVAHWFFESEPRVELFNYTYPMAVKAQEEWFKTVLASPWDTTEGPNGSFVPPGELVHRFLMDDDEHLQWWTLQKLETHEQKQGEYDTSKHIKEVMGGSWQLRDLEMWSLRHPDGEAYATWISGLRGHRGIVLVKHLDGEGGEVHHHRASWDDQESIGSEIIERALKSSYLIEPKEDRWGIDMVELLWQTEHDDLLIRTLDGNGPDLIFDAGPRENPIRSDIYDVEHEVKLKWADAINEDPGNLEWHPVEIINMQVPSSEKFPIELLKDSNSNDNDYDYITVNGVLLRRRRTDSEWFFEFRLQRVYTAADGSTFTLKAQGFLLMDHENDGTGSWYGAVRFGGRYVNEIGHAVDSANYAEDPHNLFMRAMGEPTESFFVDIIGRHDQFDQKVLRAIKNYSKKDWDVDHHGGSLNDAYEWLADQINNAFESAVYQMPDDEEDDINSDFVENKAVSIEDIEPMDRLD